ncbi:alpha/beta hydrolase [Bradyrhizobium sp. CCGUVB1N3]|uniref:alpha/beta fold hydrolase n=1 Tax=Bradyrhizobium sp. CCGUVB1N3 TaxID=2949629 RepID=UPI0020B2403A|nr:alpha/beta fold hydrolase [Bradyrhizobium sp. CCGUVB1N3]MCP3474098.1 alpha/beta hydrolase [Bradyrhizobium sp. CCGUVB1N3]
MPQPTDLTTAAAKRGLKVTQFGRGRPLLLLHGGGGIATITSFAEDMAQCFNVIMPTHPGFDGTERPSDIDGIKALAMGYVDLIADAGLKGAVAVGFSMGGWIAAEMAASRVDGLAGLVLVDAVGIKVPGETVLDVFAIAPPQIADFSYHQPDRFRIDPASLSEARRQAMQSNFAALAFYGRAQDMQDPDLAARLSGVERPTLVVWGESDRVVTPAYGRAFAEAIPGSRFEAIAACGHLPQIERPDVLKEMLSGFVQAL